MRIVTAYVQLNNNHGMHLEDRTRHFVNMCNTVEPTPVTLFIDYKSVTKVYQTLKSLKNVEIIVLNDDNLIIQSILIKQPNVKLPSNRSIHKDTEEYLRCVNAKCQFMKKALEYHPTDPMFAWIDFSIGYIFKDQALGWSRLRKAVHSTHWTKNRVHIPGCHLFYEALDLNTVNWRFCGGIFLGSRTAIEEMCALHELYANSCCMLTWEVNMFAVMELFFGWRPQWHVGNHDESIAQFDL